MEIKTLDELTKPDDFVLHYTPLGLALDHRLTPDASLRYIQSMVADCDLCQEVPEHIRQHFETCRKLHVYGYFAPEFFTAAAERVYMTLESGLGVKFLEHFPDGVPLVKAETNERRVLHPRHFWEFHDEFRKNWRKRWRVEGYPAFDGGMRSLIAWARVSGLLYGQFNQVVEDAILNLRHMGAHPHAASRLGPGDSADAIRDVAEIINHLWGRDTPGGRLYPTPLEMGVFAVQWESSGGRRVTTPERLETLSPADRSGDWFLVEAAVRDYESLLSWTPDFESTAYPTAKVWGPGTWEDAVSAGMQYRDSGRTPSSPEWRNRVFLVRAHDDGFQGCRSPDQFRRLAPEEHDRPNTCWWIVRADHPRDVYWYMQAQVSAASNPEDAKRQFAVGKIGVYKTWQEARQVLERLESQELQKTTKNAAAR